MATITSPQTTNYNNPTIPQESETESMRSGGKLDQPQIVRHPDQREWVFLSNQPEELFCGFLYLQDALETLALFDQIQAAANKTAMHQVEIIYLSKDCKEPVLDEEKGSFHETTPEKTDSFATQHLAVQSEKSKTPLDLPVDSKEGKPSV